ncbi:MAG: hypothetical protein A2Y12_19500 [Planctomycetes bacterium GWF2_42_9]|nr:MAG: hypothetical protein A2Y12_19500 [Planctomycetes bacterium GWF2_42_9]
MKADNEEWHELGISFCKIHKNAGEVIRYKRWKIVDNLLEKAGKLFFKTITIDDVDFSILIPDGFYVKPEAPGAFSKNVQCYREYWLCVLSIFCHEHEDFLDCSYLKKISLPFYGFTKNKKWKIDWSWVQDEYELAQPFFIKKTNHLINVCEASIRLCKLMTGKKHVLRIDSKKVQVLIYKNKEYKFGGGETWELFKLLYEAQGKTVEDAHILKFGQPNIVVGELRRYLRKHGANEIASAIKKQTKVGYWLDIASL